MKDYLLLQKIANKEKDANQAIDTLHQTHGLSVIKAVHKTLNRFVNNPAAKQSYNHFVDDITQDVWITIMTKAHQFKVQEGNDGSAMAWFSTIATNKTIDFLKSKQEKFYRDNKTIESGQENLGLTPESTPVTKDGFWQDSELENETDPKTTKKPAPPQVLPPDLFTPGIERKIEIEDCVEKVDERFSKKYPDAHKLIQSYVRKSMSGKQLALYLNRKEGAARQYLSECKKLYGKFLKPCYENALIS